MPAAFNLQPLKRGVVGKMIRHVEREQQYTPRHIDAARSHLNRVLYRDEQQYARVASPPARQITTGRKIRIDANVVGAAVCTLPKELGTEDLERWSAATVRWLKEACPGTLASATLHMDESRPHIHAWIRPVDEHGHLSWKQHFGGRDGRQKFRAMQQSYSAAMKPLGVHEHSREEKALRRAGYTRGINGWRVGRVLLDAQDELEKLQQQMQALALRPEEIDTHASRFESAYKHWERVRDRVRAVYALHQQAHRRAEKAEQALQHETKRLTRQVRRLTRQLEHTANLFLEQTPEKQWGDLTRLAGERGAEYLAQRVTRALSAQRAMRSFET